MILKGQLHHFFFQIPSLNENKSITPEAPSRSSSAASPELRRQGKGTGDFWKLPDAFPGPEESVQRWYSWHKAQLPRSCWQVLPAGRRGPAARAGGAARPGLVQA